MKTKKLMIKKETIANLEQAKLNSIEAGGIGATFLFTCDAIYACTSHDADPRCPILNPPGFADTEATC